MATKKTLAATLLALGLAAGPVGAVSADAPDRHGAPALELRLNNGQKWRTDEVLRAEMSQIRDVMHASLPPIHSGRYNAADLSTLGDWVQYTPPRPYAWFMRQYSRMHLADRHPPPINLVVSNVPGPAAPLYAAGAELRELYSVGPVLEGIGLNITVWSYLDHYFVGLLACKDAVTEPTRITCGMRDALAELATAAVRKPVVASST